MSGPFHACFASSSSSSSRTVPIAATAAKWFPVMDMSDQITCLRFFLSFVYLLMIVSNHFN